MIVFLIQMATHMLSARSSLPIAPPPAGLLGALILAWIQTRIQILSMVTHVQDGQDMIAVGIIIARSLLPNAPPPAGLLGAMAVAESAAWHSRKRAPEFPAAPNAHGTPLACWHHQWQVLVRCNAWIWLEKTGHKRGAMIDLKNPILTSSSAKKKTPSRWRNAACVAAGSKRKSWTPRSVAISAGILRKAGGSRIGRD